MQIMGKIPVSSVFMSVIIKYFSYIVTWSFMICRNKKESNTFFYIIILDIQLSQRIDKNINSLISEFITSAVYKINTIIGKGVSKNCLSNSFKFFFCN